MALRPGALRPGALRPGALRPGALRPEALRPGPCAQGLAPRALRPGPCAQGLAPRALRPGPCAQGPCAQGLAPRALRPGPCAQGLAPRALRPGPQPKFHWYGGQQNPQHVTSCVGRFRCGNVCFLKTFQLIRFETFNVPALSISSNASSSFRNFAYFRVSTPIWSRRLAPPSSERSTRT